jgi:uncharacterized zinc-type alcohol dehydrogenase-like protein
MKKLLLPVLALSASISSAIAQEPVKSKGYAAMSPKGNFELIEFERHPVGDNDILIDIMYAGICHSDIHHTHEDWKKETYPFVPGHEILGKVSQVGKNVKKFKVGDYAGVGCLVNGDGKCSSCEKDKEQYWDKRVLTYSSTDFMHNNEITQGGYSNNIVVLEDFALKVPANAKMEKVAPLLCAGITSYSPIRFSNVKKGDKVAIAGFGGLGHMGVKYAINMGAEVTVFDVSDDKREDALKMGAKEFINVSSKDFGKHSNYFDFILSTIPTNYNPTDYMKMLKRGGELAIVGLPSRKDMPSISVGDLIYLGQKKVYGSQIGGIKETQEVLDYSVKHNIYPEVEVISVDRIEEAYKDVLNGKVKFRYVIDMSTMK